MKAKKKIYHGDTETQRERKIQCGVYFVHGNTVSKINATLLEGRSEREEIRCVFKNLILLNELLQKGLRVFQMRYSAA
jgi:hypothetical protein